jgi:nicotinamidase-related amidase
VFLFAVSASAAESQFQLELRQREKTAKESGRFHTVTKPAKWNAKETAVIVCDMWDLHHCLNATERGGEMAPRMNEVLNEARSRGAIIIHAPSSCMAAYEDHPARKRATAAPRAKEFPKDIGRWCHKIPSEEQGEYPIDQSDGGEDDDPREHQKWAEKLKAMGRNPRAPWKSQTDLIDIHDTDYISDNGEEIWSVMEGQGIKNVILLGVHTTCVSWGVRLACGTW